MSQAETLPTTCEGGQCPWNRSSGNTPASNAPRNAGRVTLSGPAAGHAGNLPPLRVRLAQAWADGFTWGLIAGLAFSLGVLLISYLL